MKKIIVLLISCVLISCVATQDIKDSDILNQEEGILLVGLGTNWEGHDNPLLATLYLHYDEKDSSAFSSGRKLAFEGKSKILVAKLPANDYVFKKIEFGNREKEFKSGSEFKIFPEKITYIGDIDIQLELKFLSAKARVLVINEIEKSKKYLEVNYPNIILDREILTEIVEIEFSED